MLAEAAAALLTCGFDQPRRRARRLVAALLELSPADLLSRPERPLRGEQVERLRWSLGRTLEREPLSRIVGSREFWGLAFALSSDTLDPRPDSETVVAAVLQRMTGCGAGLRFLDLGTGTGCLLLALLSEFPAATGVGVDIAVGAAMTAQKNAAALGFDRRAHFLVGDWGRALSGRFDAVVANPPYIASAALADLPPEVAGYDPVLALDGGVDGLAAYRAIGEDLARLLAPGGIVAAEVGLGQADAVAAILRARDLVVDGIERDLAGIERCVTARARRS